MQTKICNVDVNTHDSEESGIISEVVMEFIENSEINEGMCSCVCINDERCCGCILQ